MNWKVSKKRQISRISLCEKCIHFRVKTRTCGKPVVGEKIIHKGETKKLCGCFMDYKTKLTFGSCPLDIWGSTKVEMQKLLDKLDFTKNVINSDRVSRYDLKKAYQIYRDITGDSKVGGSCPPCIKSDLKKVIKTIESTLQNE